MRIPLIELDEVDSTSTHAAHLLREGVQQAPFAVLARRQTGGRGRLGRVWESPEGNLCLTFALPGAGVDPTAAALVPILAATLIAEWVEEHVGIRLTLKWPNDLMFAGAKLGGILCESSVQGSAWHAFFIGIGINIESAPALAAPDKAVCLRQALGMTSPTARGLALELVRWFEARWSNAELAHAPERFRRYGIEEGQLWLAGEDLARRSATVGLGANGSLRLRPCRAESQVEELFSAQMDQRWLYQGQSGEARPIVVVDVGNTAWKAALFRKARKGWDPDLMVAVGPNDDGRHELAALRKELDVMGLPKPWPAHVASVNPAVARAFVVEATRNGLEPVAIPKRPVRLRGVAYDLAQLGIDRLALLEAVLESGVAKRSPVIAISAGTVTTVDCLALGGRHLGGLLLTGIRAKLETIAQSGAALPHLKVEQVQAALAEATFFKDPLGHTTEQAIIFGILHEVLAAVETLKAWLRSTEHDMAGEVTIWVTGGHGELVARLVKGSHRPALIVNGLRAMVLGGIHPE